MKSPLSTKPHILWLAVLVIFVMLIILARVPSILASVAAGTPFYLPIVYRASGSSVIATPTPTPTTTPPPGGAEYVVIGWNDLGMHCYDRDYSLMAVLPPYNNLWAQVILRGDPPQVVTSGINVEYSFPDNTESASKTNFWDYAYALFGVNLADNIGLAGKGLVGEMDPDPSGGLFFKAEGVPITEFSDSAPTTPYYFQLAHLVAKDQTTGDTLAETTIVAPISSEMRCDTCHNEQDPNNFRMDILLTHDEEEGTGLAAQAQGGTPVLCASCHADPALGLPGQDGVPNFSQAMHAKHAEEQVQYCYDCHPGPITKCLRDVMSQNPSNPLWCTDCHGDMMDVANPARTPWVTEPRCQNCHDPQYAENPDTLYRHSTGHGGLYCEACHNSTHAILPSREDNDNMQSIALQGYAGTIETCTVCHVTEPIEGGPHQ
jgi:hypothetical protein